MPVDARPFLTLKTAAGRIKCSRPEVRPTALGITGEASGGTVLADQPTHVLDVYVALGTPPTDLADNAVVWVDVERGQWTAFRVLRNGVSKGAGVWTLYLRPDEGAVMPVAEPSQPQQPVKGGYWE